MTVRNGIPRIVVAAAEPGRKAQSAERRRAKQRERCCDDLFYFCRDVLDYGDMTEIHRDLCRWLDKTRESPRRIVLMPRGHFKSTIVTVGGAIQAVLRGRNTQDTSCRGGPVWPPSGVGVQPTAPDHYNAKRCHSERSEEPESVSMDMEEVVSGSGPSRARRAQDDEPWVRIGKKGDRRSPLRKKQPFSVGIGSWDIRNAQKILAEIRRHIERNDKLRFYFSDVFHEYPARQSPHWTQDALALKCAADGQPTLVAFSCESPPTGFHFDRIIVDDMVTHENATSDRLRQKTLDRLGDLEYLLKSPDCPIDFVGTRHHYCDLYGTLLKREGLESFVRAAVEDGQPIFPERFSMKMLDRKKKDDPDAFDAQSMQAPRASGRTRLDLSKLIRYAARPPLDGLTIVTMLDPAVSTKLSADYSAAVAIGFDAAGVAYLLDGFRDRVGAGQLGDIYAKFIRKWTPEYALCEDVGFQAYVLDAVRQAGIESVTPVKARGRKEDRIAKLFPWIENGKLGLPREGLIRDTVDGLRYDVCESWIGEAADFPTGAHDDLLDATAHALRYWTEHLAAGVKAEERETEEEGSDEIESADRVMGSY